MSSKLRVVASCVLGVVALGLSACDSSESQPDEATGSSPEPTSGEPEKETPDKRDDPSKPQQNDAKSNDDGRNLEVTVVGDQGVLALRHSGSAPDGAAGPAGRKLITGPGGCFALTNEGPPQLLVFPSGARFVLQHGRPSATIAGSEYRVGERFEVDTTEIAKSRVTGIPERCRRGSSDTLLVVG